MTAVFFFQAEDGIRDRDVTGVQTCALPIWRSSAAFYHVNRRILAELLERWKMQPTIADSGAAALRALEAATERGHPFPLVLVDANMPEMDGFDVARKVRGNPRLAGATIMMLSSSGHYGESA